MIRIKTTAFSGLNASELIAYGTQVVSKMTNNPAYISPEPPLNALTSAIADLTAKNSLASGGDGVAIGNRNTAFSILVSLLTSLSNYVVFTVGKLPTARELAEGAGYTVVGAKRRVGPLEAPQHVRTKSLSRAIQVRWKAVYGAKSYLVMSTMDNPNSKDTEWVQQCVTTRVSVTIENQIPGQIVAYKIYALGATGLGEPSVITRGMALF